MLLPLGDTTDGPLLVTSGVTNGSGDVQPLPVDEGSVQPLAVAATLPSTVRVVDDETGQAMSPARVDVVSDSRDLLALCSDPGFMPPDVGALLAPFFVTWSGAMTSGNRALVENGLYHGNAITSSELAVEEEFDDGSYAVAARISDAPPLRPAPVRVPTMQEVRIID